LHRNTIRLQRWAVDSIPFFLDKDPFFDPPDCERVARSRVVDGAELRHGLRSAGLLIVEHAHHLHVVLDEHTGRFCATT